MGCNDEVHSNNTSEGEVGTKLKVCIVGAGAAGLVNARYLKTHPDTFQVSVYERSDTIGGTWVYCDRIGFQEDGRSPVYSSMYQNLKTNIPMCIMGFSDFPLDSGCETGFVGHSSVLSYLTKYCDHHNIGPLINFHHEIKEVRRRSDRDSWLVTIRDIDNNTTFSKDFDSVLVCNGRYSVPKYPTVKNQDSFQGKILHTHDYRKPSELQGQRVVVLGAGPSGSDISLEVSSVADTVFLCHSLPTVFPDLPANIKQIRSSIHSFEGNSVIMKDKQVLSNIDCVILATGYHYDFSFLHESCKISVSPEGRVKDVYLHLINANYPSMGIWAIPSAILPFTLYEQQARFFMKHLLKEFQLPSTQDMILDSEQDFQERLSLGIPERHAHKMAKSQMLWNYEERLVKMARLPSTKPVVKSLFNSLPVFRRDHAKEYKNWDFEILTDTEYRCLK